MRWFVWRPPVWSPRPELPGRNRPPARAPSRTCTQSQQYEQLLCSNPGFRAKRIAQECGPLQGSQFYSNCVASFQCNAPHRAPHWRHAPPSETIR